MNTASIVIFSTIFALLVSLASTVAVLYAKLKKAIGNLIVLDENGKVQKIKIFDFIRIVISAVTVAEETGKKGAEKKEIALATIQETLNQMNVDYDISEMSSIIDTLISLINVFIKSKKK